MRQFAVAAGDEGSASAEDELPKTDPAMFKDIAPDAAKALAELRDVLTKRDAAALRTNIADDVVWSLGGAPGADTAMAMWQADPDSLDQMAEARRRGVRRRWRQARAVSGRAGRRRARTSWCSSRAWRRGRSRRSSRASSAALRRGVRVWRQASAADGATGENASTRGRPLGALQVHRRSRSILRSRRRSSRSRARSVVGCSTSAVDGNALLVATGARLCASRSTPGSGTVLHDFGPWPGVTWAACITPACDAVYVDADAVGDESFRLVRVAADGTQVEVASDPGRVATPVFDAASGRLAWTLVRPGSGRDRGVAADR